MFFTLLYSPRKSIYKVQTQPLGTSRMHSCNVMSGSYLFPSFFFSAEGRQRQHKLYTLCCGSFAPMHNWPQCPEGDIRPEAILSRAFGSSGTTRHRQVTLYKGVTIFFVLLTKNICNSFSFEATESVLKLLSGAKRCVRYQKMCSRWLLA